MIITKRLIDNKFISGSESESYRERLEELDRIIEHLKPSPEAAQEIAQELHTLFNIVDSSARLAAVLMIRDLEKGGVSA